MSNAIPMALRPAVRAAHQWNSVTLTFARRYCGTQPCFTSSAPSSILSALQFRTPSPSHRSFSTSPRFAAKVEDDIAHQDIIPPQEGLPQRTRTVKIGPLPKGLVSDVTINRIFGGRVSARDGNNVLRILHHRRTSGSLADYGVDNLGRQFSHVNRQLATKALEWLREQYPVDEARAAEAWAEKEANRIAYELWLSDPENDSKYKDPARAFREHQKKEAEERALEEERRGGQRFGLLHAGKSQFELNIEEKRRQRLEAITKKAEEKETRAKEEEAMLATGEWVRTPGGTQLMKPYQTTYVDVFGREQVSRRKEEQEKYRKLSTSKYQSIEETLAATTLTQRLYPMTAFVLVLCLISYGIGHYYSPPSPEFRVFPDLSPTTATIGAIAFANLIVTLSWRILPLWPLLTRYFMAVPANPRAVQSILNVFSHHDYEHLLGNMAMLAFVGPLYHDLVDRGVFIGTYLSAGAVGSLVSLYWANVGRGVITSHSMGASAACWGITAAYLLLTDQETLKIPFIKDMEVGFYPKALMLAAVVFEILSWVRKGKKSRMDHASHVGGMLAGSSVAGYLHMNGFHQKRAEAEEEKEKTLDLGRKMKEEAKEIEVAVMKAVKRDLESEKSR